MRRLILLPAGALLIVGGCARTPPQPDLAADGPASMIAAADPRSAGQLVRGFYGVEEKSWRWSAREFAVRLGLPRTADRNGAQLALRFSIPDAVIERLHSIRLAANVNGVDLPPRQYSKAGDFTYIEGVSAAALNRNPSIAAFTLDHALPPTAREPRELGIVVREVGFELK